VRRPKWQLAVSDHLPRNRAQWIRVIERVAGNDKSATEKYVVKKAEKEKRNDGDDRHISAPSLPPLLQVDLHQLF